MCATAGRREVEDHSMTVCYLASDADLSDSGEDEIIRNPDKERLSGDIKPIHIALITKP